MPATNESSVRIEELEQRLAEAESELSRARRQLGEAQELARVGSWEWDIPQNVVWWSDQLYRIYGLEPRSILPTYEEFLSRVHPDDRESVDERNRRAFADHEPFEDVKRVVRGDGREILMSTQGEVICDEAGAPIRMVGICEDVTDREHARGAEAQLAAAEALRKRAMEINDEIIQRLVLAAVHLQRGATEDAAAAAAEARRCAQQIVDDLLTTPAAPQPGELRREAPIR
jgi:PAS domain S-box-containing protein